MPLAGKRYESLFDGKECGGALDYNHFHHTFLFASPCTKNYHHFKKDSCITVYMNPWRKAECQTLADQIELRDPGEWYHRFNLVGGIPRLVFSSCVKFETLVNRVKYVFPDEEEGMQKLVWRFVGEEFIFDDRMMHILFHLNRSEESSGDHYLTYPSLAVLVIACHRYRTSLCGARDLLQPPWLGLHSTRGRGEQRKTFLVKSLTWRKFRMRPLEQMDAATIEFGTYVIAKHEVVQAASDIRSEPMLCVPTATTFPAIDAVLVVPDDRRILYVQMAADRAHPIQYEPLNELYQGLARREEFRGYTHLLLFIVSDDIYDGFTYQPYTSTSGRVEANIGVTQYVGKFIPH